MVMKRTASECTVGSSSPALVCTTPWNQAAQPISNHATCNLRNKEEKKKDSVQNSTYWHWSPCPAADLEPTNMPVKFDTMEYFQCLPGIVSTE